MSMHQIDLTRVDLNLLVVFEVLMRERHVGRAAERLFLSQSATSHALGRLRELLGDPLFVRHPKGVEPTARALALAGPIADTLERMRAIVAPQEPFDSATLKRTFVIGATDYAVFVVLAPLMARLQAAAPTLDLRIVPVDRDSVTGAFDRGEFDFALGNLTGPPQRLEAVPLFEERFVGIVRQGHPALAHGGMTVETLVGLPHALVSPRGDPHGRLDEALAPLGLRRRVAVTVAHFLALPFLIGGSDMVGVLAERAAVRMAAVAGLSVFPLPLDVPSWTVHLLRSRQLVERPEVRWFSDLLCSVRDVR